MSRTARTLLYGVIIVVIFAVLLLGANGVGPMEIPFWLALGWVAYLLRVAPEVTISGPGVAMALLTFAGFVVGLHVAAPRVIAAFRPESDRPPWRFAWTGAITGIVVLMFAAGIGIVGVTHQVGWLMSSDERWFGYTATARVTARSNLHNIGLALHNYHDHFGHFPPGATFDETGRALHSWQTALLPWADEAPLWETINLQRPWNDPANEAAFRTIVPVYQNFWIPPARIASPPGYALTRYSANVHLFGRRDGAMIRDITDGTSNTLMAGEITDELPAWGDPTNYRDPALGIGTSPRGFNSPWADDDDHVAFFLFADGSVRFLSDAIDPQVLKALATPAGGEPIDSDGF